VPYKGEMPGGEESWFGEEFLLKRMESKQLLLWVDCSKSGATWEYQGKQWQYNKKMFDNIMEALKDIDCSDTYMLTSSDYGGERTRTYNTKIRKEWKGKLL